MQPEPETATRSPPHPYTIDGQAFYNVHQAALILEGISEKTLWNWAKRGVTSFSFDLDVKRHPVIYHRTPNSNEATPATRREFRMLLPAAQVEVLKGILQAAGRNRPGPWSRGELATLEALAHRHRTSNLPAYHI